MIANLKIYTVIGLFLAAAGSITWGLWQRNLRTEMEASLVLTQKALVERDAALAVAQKQYDGWLLAAKEREARVRAEAEHANTLMEELESAKRTDSSAAEYGDMLVHPVYLDRLRRGAESS